MLLQEVGEVGRGQVMEGFVGEEEELVLDAVLNREPVELLEDGGDVFSGAGVGEEAGSRVLNVLQFLEMSGRKSIEKAIAIIKSRSDEGMDEDFSCRLGEGRTEAGDVAEVEEGCFGNIVDMRLV